MNLAQDAEGDREHLARLGAFLKDELRANGFEPGASESQIVPVILGSNEVAICFAHHLRARGFGVRAIRPPTVPLGTARLRLSMTSKLSKDVLADLVAALVQARAEFSTARALSVSP
jgi:8-amino-7-oxononanoate synthase